MDTTEKPAAADVPIVRGWKRIVYLLAGGFFFLLGGAGRISPRAAGNTFSDACQLFSRTHLSESSSGLTEISTVRPNFDRLANQRRSPATYQTESNHLCNPDSRHIDLADRTIADRSPLHLQPRCDWTNRRLETSRCSPLSNGRSMANTITHVSEFAKASGFTWAPTKNRPFHLPYR